MEDLKFLTVTEIARVMRLSKMTVYRLVHAGAFDGTIQIGRSFRVPEAGVHAYLRRSLVPGDGDDDGPDARQA